METACKLLLQICTDTYSISMVVSAELPCVGRRFTQHRSLFLNFYLIYDIWCRSQWPCGLRRRSAAARLLRLWVRIPPGAWMFVCCECCVLSGKGLCDGLVTRPEEFYRLWCVVVCDLETSRLRRSWPALGRSATKKSNMWYDIFNCNWVATRWQ